MKLLNQIPDGFIKQTFFYQIGGGEDEDDRDVWVNSDADKVIFKDGNKYRKCKWSKCNYVNGLDYENSIVLKEIIE